MGGMVRAAICLQKVHCLNPPQHRRFLYRVAGVRGAAAERHDGTGP
jgi:hypothetical protein